MSEPPHDNLNPNEGEEDRITQPGEDPGLVEYALILVIVAIVVIVIFAFLTPEMNNVVSNFIGNF